MIDASLSLAVLMIGSVRDSDASGRYVLHCFSKKKGTDLKLAGKKRRIALRI